MQNVIQSGDYASLLHAELKKFAYWLGFHTFAAAVVIDHPSRASEFIAIDNTPTGYLDTYNDMALSRHDPVMQHCKTRGVPIIWDQGTYVRAQQGDKWEIQAQHGYRCGIAWAMHLPSGRHFVLGVDRDQALPVAVEELARMAATLQLFAVHAQEAMANILTPVIEAFEVPALTPRELETLRWTMEGKTAWEVGRILGIAEDTAVRHAHSASRKLGCSSKHQAVVKALRLGLIH